MPAVVVVLGLACFLVDDDWIMPPREFDDIAAGFRLVVELGLAFGERGPDSGTGGDECIAVC